jgi:HD-GYP domain-containing protein (c-di-GMP phosphodiesterase class II)
MEETQVIIVADVVEAMISHRPYRPALGVDAALNEILNNTEKLYKPEVVEACVGLFRNKGYQIDDSEIIINFPM